MRPPIWVWWSYYDDAAEPWALWNTAAQMWDGATIAKNDAAAKSDVCHQLGIRRLRAVIRGLWNPETGLYHAEVIVQDRDAGLCPRDPWQW